MHFLIWGAFHGILLVLHKEYQKLCEMVGIAEKLLSSKVYHWASVVVTFHLVVIGWVFFRAENMNIAGQMLSKMLMAPVDLLHFTASQLNILQIRDPIIFPALLIILPVLMISQVVIDWLNNKRIYQSPPWALQVCVMVALMCVLTVFSPDTSPKFIYFQF